MPFTTTTSLCQKIVRLFPERPFAIEFWDGTTVPATGAGGPTFKVRSPRAIAYALSAPGQLGLSRAYVSGELEVEDLDAVADVWYRWNPPTLHAWDRFRLGLAAVRASGATMPPSAPIAELRPHGLPHSKARDARAVRQHYDVSNDFFALFLDRSMTYSCAFFSRDGGSLESAQQAKLELTCRKLGLEPGQRVLDIGCGWGSFAIHAARTRGCRVTAATISREQHRLASERVAAAGLSDRVTVVYRDYRQLAGRFDKVVSIEMLEAVGYDYWGAYFATISRLLPRGGTALIQTITIPDQRFDRYRRGVDWTQKHIFPGSLIPAVGALAQAIARASDLTIVGLSDIGPHYATTLRAWRERFFARLADVRALGFDERFIRMWDMYLSWSQAVFAERTHGDAQILLRRMG